MDTTGSNVSFRWPTWDYKVLECRDDIVDGVMVTPSQDFFETEAQVLGADGWELVSVMSGHRGLVGFFKRMWNPTPAVPIRVTATVVPECQCVFSRTGEVEQMCGNCANSGSTLPQNKI